MSWVILLRLVLKLKGSGLVTITLVSSANRTNLELAFVNWGRLPEEWKELIIMYLFTRRGIKQIAVIIEAYHFCQPLTKFYPTPCGQG